MKLRIVVLILVLAVGATGLYAWQRNTQKAGSEQAMEAAPPGMPPHGEAEAMDPGVTWQPPSSWAVHPAGGMRAATYDISGTAGDAECVVFYFGPGQGGTVEANMERWIGEFKNPSSPDRSNETVHGIAIHRVKVKGTYSAHAMGMGGESQEEKDAALIGAIAEGPNGSLFFKLTGPQKTVEAAEKDFNAMLSTLTPS
jgi:hypothetical protein